MPFTLQFWRALADYVIKFPDLTSAGVAFATWLTEYNRVGRSAFASILIDHSQTEGGSSGGSRQFPQETLIDALHCRRYDLDNAYELPPHLADYPAAKIARASRRGRGFTLRFSS